jgi:dipeptidyl aminopeptidase/acylaminoacyl peptidase
VVDVNYGGSTGYGRAYRERLKGQWGIVDAVDCVHAARYLVEQDWVDGERLIIRGGSAGGWTTLCALIFHDTFKCGASYYGVADLEPFAEITHKFEQHYDESLIGPQGDKALYRERSPINHTERLSCPVIFFQGTEDKIVPPSQTEDMVAAMEEKRLPYAYLLFEGEGHGFRRADTIERWLEAELYFYSRIFDFELGDPVKSVQIKNL